MDKKEEELIRSALKTEKDPRVVQRLGAVQMRLVCGDRIEDVAKRTAMSHRWVSKWVARYEEGGIAALQDLPREGRPPAVDRDKMEKFMLQEEIQEKCTPQRVQQMIIEKFGVVYHILHVRRLLHKSDISPKSSQPVHIHRATVAAVRSWQWRLEKMFSRLRREGFRLGAFDESHFIHNMKTGRKYWSRKGSRINVPYTGSHRKITAYGTIFFNGDRFVTAEEATFTSDSFIAHLKDLTKRYGKVALFVDRARQHMSKKVKKFLKQNRNIRLIPLPKASPFLNGAIEKFWDKVKREVLTGEFYLTFEDMYDALMKCFRTMVYDVRPRKYLYRKASEYCTN